MISTFFVYGLAFFTLGLTLLIRQPPIMFSRYANTHYLIGAFALIHSLAEWLIMASLITDPDRVETYRFGAMIVGGVSFIVLAYAAREVATFALPKIAYITRMLVPAFSVIWLFFLSIIIAGGMDAAYLDLVGRWLLGGPSAVLIGLALIRLARRDVPLPQVSTELSVSDRQIRHSLYAFAFAGGLLGLYGISTFFGVKVALFPFEFINAEAFKSVFGVAPPMVRTILTIGMLVGFLRFVNGFAEFERRERESTIKLRTEDLLHANEELTQAMRELEEASASKSAFLASMSHELRTPLNAILGFSDVLAQQYFGPPGAGKYREYAGYIRSSGEHLLSLINDLLDISMIEAGKKELSLEDLEISPTLYECARSVKMRLEERGIALKMDLQHDDMIVRADGRAVRQIVLNLLSNAAKFSKDGGEVRLSVREEAGVIRLSVSDTGIGMTDQQVATATDPFVKNAANPHVSEQGWGLGLAITHSLVRLHDGAFEIESEIDQGTRVTVSLPRHGPQA